MKIRVTAVSKKDVPSQWGGTWKVVKIKCVGQGDEVFELQGFGKNEKENLKPGSELSGYFSERMWNSQSGPVIIKTFNKITAEYVYELLMSKFPEIDNAVTKNNEMEPSESSDGWSTLEDTTGEEEPF